MNDEQKLYPQLIYRINSKLSELKIASGIIDGEGNKTVGQIVAPSVFNPYGRSFHWLVVADDKWEFLESNDGWFGNIITHIQKNKDKWKEFKKKYATNEDKIEIKSIEDVFEILDNTAYNENDNEKEKKEKRDKYHHALLTVFQFYPVVSHKYIDGIIYRNLKRLAEERADKALSTHKIDYAIANLLIDENKKETFAYKDTYKLYPWAEVKFHGSNPETKYSCQENNSKEENKYPEDPDIDKKEIAPIPTFPSSSSNRNPAVVGTDSFFHNYFLPFFAGYEDFKTEAFFELKPKHFNKFKHILIAPLYDAYIDGEYYGNLCGTLQIPFKAAKKKPKKSEEPNELIKFKKRNLEKLISNSHLLTSEIKEAAIFEVLQQPIENPDLLEHFIKYITLVQDWERIMVWKYDSDNKNDASEAELDYCYERYDPSKVDNNGDQSNPKRNKNEWMKCIADKNEKCVKCTNFDDLKDWIKKRENKHRPIAENDKNAKRKALLENIFSTKLIPELYPEDETKYKNTRLIFEYPCYTVFPKDEPNSHKLGLHYERQQIDILRQMALQLKVKRETVKHGTKAAVSAIMSRNMSHNIGSHVLSYWKADINREVNSSKINIDSIIKGAPLKTPIVEELLIMGKAQIESLEKSSLLFDYLKNRMDFIAEITTTPPSWEKSMMFKTEIIEPFLQQRAILDNLIRSEGFCYFYYDNPEESGAVKNVTKSCPECSTKAGQTESLKPFTIYPDISSDIPVSIPHGTIGVHAVYSILENFIRNSAKHGGRTIKQVEDNEKPFLITLKVEDKEDYVSVTIIDNVGNCNKVIDGKGARVIDLLSKAIDDNSEESSYVDRDGRLSKGSWGIKEIKLSANFLRMRDTDSLIDKSRIEDSELNTPLISLNCFRPGCKTNDCSKAEQDQNIAFTIYLRKPKEVFIVYDNDLASNGIKSLLSDGIKVKLKQHGIELSSISDLKKKLDNGENVPHRFIIFDSADLLNKADLDKPEKSRRERLPFRIIVNGANGNGTGSLIKPVYTGIDYSCLNTDITKFLKNLYKQYVKSKFGNNNRISIVGTEQDSVKKWQHNNMCFIDDRNTNPIAFHDHGKNYTKGELKRYSYYHPFGSTIGFTFNMLMQRAPDDKTKKELALYELIEMARVKVVIADERIFNNNKDKQVAVQASTKPRLIELMKEKMGVSIVEILGGKVDKSKVLTDVNMGDFLVIHQGLIDKMSGKEEFLKAVKKAYTYVVIDSGRGVPENLLPETRYIEIGALERFIDELDKYSLIQTLYSLRRPKDV